MSSERTQIGKTLRHLAVIPLIILGVLSILGLTLLAVGVILLAYMRRRGRAKAESEKRIGQARRRRFMEVAREKRLGLPRRNRDCPPDGMGNIVIDGVDPLAYLTRARKPKQSDRV